MSRLGRPVLAPLPLGNGLSTLPAQASRGGYGRAAGVRTRTRRSEAFPGSPFTNLALLHALEPTPSPAARVRTKSLGRHLAPEVSKGVGAGAAGKTRPGRCKTEAGSLRPKQFSSPSGKSQSGRREEAAARGAAGAGLPRRNPPGISPLSRFRQAWGPSAPACRPIRAPRC